MTMTISPQLRAEFLDQILHWWISQRERGGRGSVSILDLHTFLPNLRGLWPLSSVDENGLNYDFSGQARHLTNNNSVTISQDELLAFAAFDGTNWLSRATEAGIQLVAPITIGCYVYLNSLPTGSNVVGLVSKWKTTGAQRSYVLYLDSVGFKFAFSSTGSTIILANHAGYKPRINEWIHLTGQVVTNGSFFSPRITVNGAIETNTATTANAIFNSNADLEIGSMNAGADSLNGRIALPFIAAHEVESNMIQALAAIRELF